MDKLAVIQISNCCRCQHNQETTIRGFNSYEFLAECRFDQDKPRLIQRHDEEFGPFPEWCPLEDAVNN